MLSADVRQPSPQPRGPPQTIDQVRREFVRYLRQTQLRARLNAGKRRHVDRGRDAAAPTLSGSTVERARWTDERLDDRMTAIDTTFDRVFDELRAERVELRAELSDRLTRLDDRLTRLDDRITRIDDRLDRLDVRLSQLGFRAVGILAAGLIALVATQL